MYKITKHGHGDNTIYRLQDPARVTFNTNGTINDGGWLVSGFNKADIEWYAWLFKNRLEGKIERLTAYEEKYLKRATLLLRGLNPPVKKKLDKKPKVWHSSSDRGEVSALTPANRRLSASIYIKPGSLADKMLKDLTNR